MHITYFTMKDGTKLTGVVWTDRPMDGWCEITAGTSPDLRIYYRDVLEAYVMDRINISGEQRVDVLQKAKDHGWDGT